MIYFNRNSKDFGSFSNFSISILIYKGRLYNCAEAAWQAQKDPSRAEEFVGLNGSQSKRLGRSVNLRSDWEEIKYFEMVDVLICKFTQNSELGALLISTGEEELVEDTTGWHDNIWGCCYCSKCKGKEGKNLLGKALMEVRNILRYGRTK